jgi:nucleoside-diphosphate-sugar epimerase
VLEHGAQDWRALRGARLFITGGTGFFGRWLLGSIAAANARLRTGINATVLARDPAAFLARAPQFAREPFLHWHAGDVRDFPFPEGAYSHVIHAAAPTGAAFVEDKPQETFDTIVDGTRRVLEFAALRGVTHLLNVSSGAVYGRQPPTLERVPETYTGAPGAEPASAYAEGKRAAELLCIGAGGSGGLRPAIARCFAFVGPHLPLDTHFAIGNFIRDALNGGPIVVSGDGTPLRSYLHAADLVPWLIAVLVRGAPGRPYNVGGDVAVSIADLARKVARIAGHGTAVTIRGTPSGAPPSRYVPSVERAREELHVSVGIALDGAIERTLHWLRSTR